MQTKVNITTMFPLIARKVFIIVLKNDGEAALVLGCSYNIKSIETKSWEKVMVPARAL